jgi:hypothetical protein
MDKEKNQSILKFINDVYLSIFPYLTTYELLQLGRTSQTINEIVKTYISKNRQPLLRFPSEMKCIARNVGNLGRNIEKACSYFRKQPSECRMVVPCTIAHSEREPLVVSNPSLRALKVIRQTGIKILLNINFEVQDQRVFRESCSSYTVILQQILETLQSTESIDLNFSSHEILDGMIGPNWFAGISAALIKLENLSSLGISGRAPWRHIMSLNCLPSLTQLRKLKVSGESIPEGNHFTDCLVLMPQLTSLTIENHNIEGIQLLYCLYQLTELTSFSIFDVKIVGIDNFEQFCKLFQNALPQVSSLRLSRSWVETSKIHEMLPYIRNLLSNLLFLDLSDNDLDMTVFQYDIVPALRESVSNLTSLNLSHNNIGMPKENAHELVPLLQSLPNLVELNMNNNHIDIHIMSIFIPYLRNLRFLTSLDVSSNNIDVPLLLELTESWHSLRVLNFSDNEPEIDESEPDYDS